MSTDNSFFPKTRAYLYSLPIDGDLDYFSVTSNTRVVIWEDELDVLLWDEDELNPRYEFTVSNDDVTLAVLKFAQTEPNIEIMNAVMRMEYCNIKINYGTK